MKKIILALALALLVLGAGCTQMTGTAQQDAMVKPTESMMESDQVDGIQPDAMMQKGVVYAPFTQAAYDQARSEGKVIFLEFYANWCGECKAQAPVLEDAFATLEKGNVAAFRVNYNDDQTDEDERLLARQFGITYQHTHIILDTSGAVVTRAQGQWSVEDVHREILKVAN